MPDDGVYTLQRTATHCNALQRTATRCNALLMMLTRLALWRVLRCVAVRRSVLQCVAVCCSVATTSGLQKVSGLSSRRDQQIEDLFEKKTSKNPQECR